MEGDLITDPFCSVFVAVKFALGLSPSDSLPESNEELSREEWSEAVKKLLSCFE